MINVSTTKNDAVPYGGHVFFAGAHTRKHYTDTVGPTNTYPAFMDELPEHLPNGEHECLIDGKFEGRILTHMRYDEGTARRTWIMMRRDFDSDTHYRIMEKIRTLLNQDKQMEAY